MQGVGAVLCAVAALAFVGSGAAAAASSGNGPGGIVSPRTTANGSSGGRLASVQFRRHRGRQRLVTLLATLTWRLRAVKAGKVYELGWKPAASEKGKSLAFCVVGEDAAGNKSRPSCVKLTVKP